MSNRDAERVQEEEYTPQEKKPCRFCGTPTRQRADSIPYCSMDCIEYRRKEQNGEMLKCPYPDCDWFKAYRPDSGLSRSLAYTKADEHREQHREELGASA